MYIRTSALFRPRLGHHNADRKTENVSGSKSRRQQKVEEVNDEEGAG
jgi:hypothetical protein